MYVALNTELSICTFAESIVRNIYSRIFPEIGLYEAMTNKACTVV